MYLMNVPPVAAAQTKWRTCSPPGGFRLPMCFNDSDGELSTRGTQISDKVQMIIESLRSTQSSLDMGDEVEGNVLPGHDGLPQVCKVAVASYAGAKSKSKGPAGSQQAGVSSQIDHESSDSDSDDSVDRGIEEAILEYLKEKDDHKRKADPRFAFLQSSKIPEKSPLGPEVSKQNSDSNTFSFNQFPNKMETPTAAADIPIKKYIKNKASLYDNAFKNLDSNKSTTNNSLVFPREPSLFNKVQFPVSVKMEEDSNDSSSSDDGIEEAIQRYQLEKKEQQSQTVYPFAVKDESDSTSDDGIEEAIRRYQLEQLKEKSVLNPFLQKQQPFTKSLMQAVGSTSAENTKKHRLKKKKSKSAQPPSSVARSSLTESSKSKGNGLVLFKEHLTSVPPKVNTTAELMCAEAILDISKTVIPGPFQQGVGLSGCPPAESSPPGEESDGSSIDSEDGIEQEIRKFLEQKAQMQKPQERINPPEKAKTKQVATQKKPSRLSLTQRQKHKEGTGSAPNSLGTDDVKETASKPSPERGGGESSPSVFSERNQTHSVAGSNKTEQSGDKSSSLDSDEDLDTAIKDLLKTKKKSKKKTRDLKRKSRTCPKDEGVLQGNALETKKFKPDPTSKPLKRVEKSKDEAKAGFSKASLLQHKLTNKSKVHDGQDFPLPHNTQSTLETKDDSSSVDSDDSIELEIRRFLAEKAKVTTVEKSKDGDISRNGAAVFTALQDEDVQRENQLAEIPTISPLSGQPPPPRSWPLLAPPSSSPNIPADGVPSCLSAQSGALLEPADGAGAARTEQRRPTPGRGDVQAFTAERPRPVLTSSSAHSRSESIKWRQSLGLPTPETRAPIARTTFHVTSSKINDTPSASPLFQSGTSKPQTPLNVWSSARTGRSPFACSAEKNPMFRPPVLNHSSAARQLPRVPFARSLAPGHGCPIEGETESMVHIPKDKSVFVELETNRTNHVQVRSRERSEGTEVPREIKREGESAKKLLERAEEEFIDEAESEAGSRRSPDKQQGSVSMLSLSRAIDPGITFVPCIALSTEDRSTMYRRRYLGGECMKGLFSDSSAPVKGNTLQKVKRRLQFVPVDRRSDTPSLCSVTK